MKPQQEPNSPLVPREFLPTEVHTAALLRSLGEFATMHPRYKRGAIDQFNLKLGEVLRFDIPESIINGWSKEVSGESDEEVDTYRELSNDFSVTYDFSADRTQLDAGRILHQYEFSLTAEQENMPAPSYIAALEYPDLEPADAVNAIGPVLYRHKLSFRISTDDRTLSTCDSYTYIDWAGDEVTSVCGCTDHSAHDKEEVPVIKVIADDESGEEVAVMQLLAFHEAARQQHEVIEVGDIDTALGMWLAAGSMSRVGVALQEKAYDDNLLLAFGTLGALKRTLKEMTG